MHIKQIIIQGFKSYKDQTVIEPFSPRHNVIIGRNGTGKSNFFAAIRFVLSDDYTQLGREERAALLHEGSGQAIMTAYVEIVFDNSDDRFPTGKEEVILRRTIGQKKDEYSLDRKSATRHDVQNLLESAGFSRSNPYYIVPQGRVTDLTRMKDDKRLELLKQVAGTQVYEARRAESIKIMSDTDSKRSKTDDALKVITDRLDELQEDKEELQQYRDLDKERRCLEYTYYTRITTETQAHMDELDEQRNTGHEADEESRATFLKGEKILARFDQQISDFKQKVELLKLDRKQYDDERRDLARQRAKAELNVNTTTEGQNAADAASNQRRQDMKTLQHAIRDSEAKLAKLMPKYTQAKTQEDAARKLVDEAEAKRKRLYAKQGRNAKFKSKGERDTWLQKEIAEVMEQSAVRKAGLMNATEDVNQIESDLEAAEGEITRLRQEIDNHGSNTDAVVASVQKAKDARDALLDDRKKLWREQARLESVMRNTQESVSKAERSLSHMMDQNTSRGLAAVRRIKQQHNLDGVYGTVAELFTVPDRFRTAVEVTAGNSLFHYVVDNDETATKVLNILQKEQAGRVTFMPLNRLHTKPVNMPNAPDALDMISKLEFDPAYEKAMRHIFGRTVICPNLQIAAQYARSHGVNAITPGGDRSDKKGALTGGYHDPKSSRLEGTQTLKQYQDEYDTQRTRNDEIKRELEKLEQEVTRSLNNLNKAEQQQQRSANSIGPLQQELRNKQAELQTMRTSVEQKLKAKTNVEASLREASEQQSAYEAEKQSDFKKALTDAEDSQLDDLTSTIPDLRRKAVQASTTRSELEVEKSALDVELEENFRPRLDQLKAQEQEDQSGSGTVSGSSSNIKDLQRDLKRLSKKVNEADARLQEVDDSLEQSNGQINELQQQHSEQRGQQEELARAIEKQQKRSEKGMTRRARLADQLSDATKSIRELGSIPNEATATVSKYTKMASTDVVDRIKTTQDKLKKYSHVNKKAFEQWNDFTRRQEALSERRVELDKSQASIRDLIKTLDMRKDEAIERTFKQVSREFAYVFGRLVPAGKGRLIIQRRSDAPAGNADADGVEEDEDEVARRKKTVENYTGVGIAVSFNSKHDEQQRIQQLSGGQRSLVALALVFAIQRCDPAPFYLFDEIDANLDAQYRTAVAKLIKEISAGKNEDGDDTPAQFICTTFRSEMVLVAEKCYSVTYNARSSRIGVETREGALEFVEKIVGAQ